MKNEKNKTHITAEEHFSVNSGFKGRVSAEYADIKISVMDFRDIQDEEADDKTVFSLYSAFFSAGRMKKEGLLKEMSSPSDWYAGSETYSEISDYSEDTYLKRNGNWVLKLNASDYFLHMLKQMKKMISV